MKGKQMQDVMGLPASYVAGMHVLLLPCTICGGKTLHKVLGKTNLAYCLEHGSQELTRAQIARVKQREREEKQPSLF